MATPDEFGRTERRRRRNWSRGRKALELLLTQSEWTHRRAETFSLQAHGETRQRVSWDFTLPEDLAIAASRSSIAIPLATLRKTSLKRLDVTDASGTSVPIWGTQDNGELATEALVSGLSGVLGRTLPLHLYKALRAIVFAAEEEDCQAHLSLIKYALEAAGRGNEGTPLLALAQDLASNFVFFAEMPEELAGKRSLVKMNYEGDVRGEGDATPTLGPVHVVQFDGAAWSSTASWHVEVHAPPGLAIRALTAWGWDTDNADIVELAASPSVGHTAHIAGRTTAPGSIAWSELELRPARTGLVSQTLAGALATWVLILSGLLLDDRLFEAVDDPNRASAFVAVMLAVPAFLIALLSRGQEHALVSRLLLLPRMVNLAVAAVLLLTAASLVLGLNQDAFTVTLRALLVASTILLLVAWAICGRSVGGDL